MAKNIVKHYQPDARVIFVKRFQKSGEDISDSDVIVAELDDLASVSVERTVRNSPGTFNLTINNNLNKFIEPDDPNIDIPALYKGSKRQTKDTTVTYRAQPKNTTTNTTSANSGGVAKNTVNTEVSTSDEDPDVANSYEFQSVTDWKQFKHIFLEDPDIPDSRYAVSYIRSESTGDVKERWALDDYGRIIYVVDTPASEASLSSKLNSETQGFEYTCKVLESDQKQKSQATDKVYRVYWYSNELFFTKYKDTDIQGDVKQNTFLKGKSKISPMDRVIIFLSERFPKADKQRRLVRVFTGVVSSVQDGWSGNDQALQVSGEDVTKYLQLSVINANPALLLDNISAVDQFPGDNITVWGNIFKTKKVTDIIKAILLGSDSIEGEFGGGNSISGIGYYKIATTGKAKDIRYNADTEKLEYVEDSKSKGRTNTYNFKDMLGELFEKSSVHIMDPFREGSKLSGYRAYELVLQNSWSFYQADFKTRREIAYKSAEDLNFLFYADAHGHIWFRPPRFGNNHILGDVNPDIWIIKPDSIISYGFIEDDSQIYSSVYVTTEPKFGLEGTVELGRFTASYRDDVVVLKYGQRLFTYSNPVIRADKKEHIQMYAKSLLQRMLATKYSGQITITGRAEIEPGRPVYIPERNRIYYIETVSHSLSFGGQFTTTLHLSYGRKPWEHVSEILTFSAKDDVFLADGHILDQALAEDLK